MCPTLPLWEPVLTEAKCVERLQLIKDFFFSCFLQYGGEDAVRLLLED